MSKSLQSQRTEKNYLKKLLPLKKIKNADTRADTERQERKITMTEKLNIDNGLQDWKTEHQAVTRGIKYWGLSDMPSASPAGKVLIG